MKIQFNVIGIKHDITNIGINSNKNTPKENPAKHVISLISVDNDINIDITVDSRQLIIMKSFDQLKNNIFELDFGPIK